MNDNDDLSEGTGSFLVTVTSPAAVKTVLKY